MLYTVVWTEIILLVLQTANHQTLRPSHLTSSTRIYQKADVLPPGDKALYGCVRQESRKLGPCVSFLFK
jgi:hypothetical protein